MITGFGELSRRAGSLSRKRPMRLPHLNRGSSTGPIRDVLAADGPTLVRMTLPSGIPIDELDPGIRPQDGLFRHVNGRWLARTEIPADRARDSTFRILADQAENAVRETVQEAGRGRLPGTGRRWRDDEEEGIMLSSAGSQVSTKVQQRPAQPPAVTTGSTLSRLAAWPSSVPCTTWRLCSTSGCRRRPVRHRAPSGRAGARCHTVNTGLAAMGGDGPYAAGPSVRPRLMRCRFIGIVLPLRAPSGRTESSWQSAVSCYKGNHSRLDKSGKPVNSSLPPEDT